MEVTLALLADYVNITKEGKLNVMGLFTEILTPSIPVILPQMQLVLKMDAPPGEWETQKKIEIKLMDEDANMILAITGDMNIPKGKSGRPVQVNSVFNFNNIQFAKEGDYQFAILVGGETKKEIPVRVTYTPPNKKTPS